MSSLIALKPVSDEIPPSAKKQWRPHLGLFDSQKSRVGQDGGRRKPGVFLLADRASAEKDDSNPASSSSVGDTFASAEMNGGCAASPSSADGIPASDEEANAGWP